MKTFLRSGLGRLVNTVAVAVLLAAAPSLHAAPGDLDPLDANLVGTFVRATAVQPDGKTIIAGAFTSVLGVPRSNIARLNADGTLDMGFDPRANGGVNSVAMQADGKVLLGGGFTTLRPNGAGAATARQNIARVNADGTLDTGFNPRANLEVECVAVQADGKVLLGGSFTTLQPNGAAVATARSFIARVNANGTLDTGFDPRADRSVYSVAVQADGKVLLGGAFFTLQPNGAAERTWRNRIARLNADGTLDTGFHPNPDAQVLSVAVQADGKVLLGGFFTTLQPNGAGAATARSRIARVNADGTLDTGFDPKADNGVNSVAVQADGKVLLGGYFSTLQPNGAAVATARQYVARINASGTLDTGFNPRANDTVYSVSMQADGKVLLGGAFTALQPNGSNAATARNRFALLQNDPAIQTLTVPDATQALWQRGGAAPELSRVTFELSTDGGASWNPLGAGTRIGTTANWQLTSLFSGSGSLRARGVTSGGSQNGSSGLTEQVRTFSGFPISSNADLSALTATAGEWLSPLTPAFAAATTAYTAIAMDDDASSITVTPTAGQASATIQVRANGGTFAGVTSGSPSGALALNVGENPVDVLVTAHDGTTTKTYSVTVTRYLASSNADLSALTTTAGALTPAFTEATTAYTASVVFGGRNPITVTPTKSQANATIQVRINGGTYASVTSGSPSGALDLNVGTNTVDVLVTAHDGATTKTYTLTVTRAAPTPGDLDLLNVGLGSDDSVRVTAVQPDGKTIIAGDFGSVLGVPRRNIARLNANGTLDMGFDPRANNSVNTAAVQADGKVLLGGYFTTLQPNGAGAATARQFIARLNADGTLDTGFDPRANDTVFCVAEQADGKVLLIGWFTTLQPNDAGAATARQYIARVNADGTLDTGFDPRADSGVLTVAVQADGKVLLGGFFTAVNGVPRNYIARVNANGTLDTGFDPNASLFVRSMAVQADGKVLLGGHFTTLRPNGAGAATARQNIARVNADGTLDTGFDPRADDGVFSVAVQADGKVLLGGYFTTLQPNGAGAATARQYVARINASGTLDTGFDPHPNNSVLSVAVQADGKVLIGGHFSTLQPNGSYAATPRNSFARLQNDPAIQTLTVPDATQALWQRGGAAPELSRVTFAVRTDGGTNWSPLGAGTRIGTTANWQLTSLLSGSGSLRARGATTGGDQNGSSGLIELVTTFSGFPVSSNAELSALTTTAGALTPAFAAAATAYTASVLFGTSSITVTPTAAQGSATIQVRVNGGTFAGVTSGGPSGALALNVGTNPVDLLVTAHDTTTTKTYTLTVTRAAPTPGGVDLLDPKLGSGDYVLATAVQPDGKTIIAGTFTSVLGVARRNVARLNADGTLDTGFDVKPDYGVSSVAVQADGKVLLGGHFTTLQPNGAASPIARSRIARVNADGTLDTGFDPRADSAVMSVAVQADGKVLLGGGFNTLQPNGAASPTVRSRIARVNADGTLDTGFDPNPNGWVSSVAVQEDGKVLLGGYFTTLQPNGAGAATSRPFIARVNADGTFDTGFDPNPDRTVLSVVVQADGKVLLGGWFYSLQPNGAVTATARQHIARVNANGTLDTGFDPRTNGEVYSVAVQADGKVLLGGYFTTLQPNGAGAATARQHIARVNADGTLDTDFDPSADDIVTSVAVQADGKVLLGGDFTTLQPAGAATATVRKGFARILNDPATQTLSAPDATQNLWQRGGAAPELSRVTFELSTDGGANWIPLGAGTRIGTTANWQRTGLALPASGQLRARGVTSGGYGNGSSGLIEQVAAFPFSPDADNDGLLDSWELTWWPATEGHGPHDDDDHDGSDNLLELAFGLNPTLPDSGGLPVFVDEGGFLTVTITKRPGVIYEVQSANIPLPGSFSAANTTVIINNATTLKVRDTVPTVAGPRRFLRVMVTAGPLDPKLDPEGLQDNGGPSKTLALRSDSPAIDAGTSAGLSGPLGTDQRGAAFPRAIDFPFAINPAGGDGTDIGAFEFPMLKMDSVVKLPDGHILLRGTGIPNRQHTIQASHNLGPNSFVEIGNPIADANGALQYDDAAALILEKRFYRLTFLP